jgi:hypothetical protein
VVSVSPRRPRRGTCSRRSSTLWCQCVPVCVPVCASVCQCVCQCVPVCVGECNTMTSRSSSHQTCNESITLWSREHLHDTTRRIAIVETTHSIAMVETTHSIALVEPLLSRGLAWRHVAMCAPCVRHVWPFVHLVCVMCGHLCIVCASCVAICGHLCAKVLLQGR